ncbi:hypothetical protein [Aridibaculum aurantiacum]|uniref:hypothetical protein n=1 Tax=Aridibaculum aurantiacum TaxID=2810307 RepID=UPI001A95C60F|nr:hypothetical protein [Aridibaculum aurantiacum]
MKFLFFPLLLLSFHVSAQCKSSRKAANGETINCIDNNNLKQGKWSVKVDGLRGEPGYEEEGIYKDGKKEGVWRIYTLMGDLFAIERYRWGQKDGVSQYYSMAGIAREESWKAVNPENPYDTIDVPDVYDPYKVQRKVIKIEGEAVKHGTWRYYNDGMISRTEKYFLGKKEDPNQLGATTMIEVPVDSVKKAPAKVKPQAVLDFEKKNAGKKNVKFRDGRTF